ncbi:Uncharacterized protein Fot_25450 [Forsythia ovata]|uniref:Uncharacterized protein n=1 Tax=Forsythia ovata TaxID=205694 RepID=A0ABD1U970_9LAMI
MDFIGGNERVNPRLLALFTSSHAFSISLIRGSIHELLNLMGLLFNELGETIDEEADNPESIIYMPSLASWRVMSSFSLVVKVAPGDCLPSRSVVSKIRTYFGQEYGWGYTPVGCHGGSSKGQGHFCHLRSPWRLKRKRVCSLLEWNEEMGWDTITLCLQIEEEAAIDEMRKFTETDSGVGGRGVRG